MLWMGRPALYFVCRDVPVERPDLRLRFLSLFSFDSVLAWSHLSRASYIHRIATLRVRVLTSRLGGNRMKKWGIVFGTMLDQAVTETA
jgi:hypothetical protein